MNCSFDYATTITIGDTDLMQAVYFAHFFKLQGVVRELWVLNAVDNSRQLLRDGVVLITRSAASDYHRNLHLFDPVVCRMQIRSLKAASAELVFRFHHGLTGELHAEGLQRVAFMDRSGRVRRMPEEFRTAALRYLEVPEPTTEQAIAEACLAGASLAPAAGA
jgi:acyl-CoA thioesterase FadM